MQHLMFKSLTVRNSTISEIAALTTYLIQFLYFKFLFQNSLSCHWYFTSYESSHPFSINCCFDYQEAQFHVNHHAMKTSWPYRHLKTLSNYPLLQLAFRACVWIRSPTCSFYIEIAYQIISMMQLVPILYATWTYWSGYRLVPFNFVILRS